MPSEIEQMARDAAAVSGAPPCQDPAGRGCPGTAQLPSARRAALRQPGVNPGDWEIASGLSDHFWVATVFPLFPFSPQSTDCFYPLYVSASTIEHSLITHLYSKYSTFVYSGRLLR